MFTAANGDRAGVPNYLVIMTDGRPDNETAAWSESIRARNMGITIVAVRTLLNDNYYYSMAVI